MSRKILNCGVAFARKAQRAATTSANAVSSAANKDSLIAADAPAASDVSEKCDAVDDGGILPGSPLNSTIGGSPVSHHDDGAIPFDAVEAYGNAIIHRKPDGRAVRPNLGIDDSRKRLGVIHVAARQVQNDLLGKDLSRERREFHIHMSD